MPRFVVCLCVLLWGWPGHAQGAEPVKVMVVGAWHFANHNLDLHNVQAEDVRGERRQHELRRVAEALATFKPSKVVIEKVAPGADLIDPDFRQFTPASLRQDRSERVQLGYRIAHHLGLNRVYAINEQPSGGEPDYFPYGKLQDYARARGLSDQLRTIQERTAADVAAFTKTQQDRSMADLLIHVNRPDSFNGNAPYYRMLGIGDTEEQPGAELNAMWYLRNAKIFAKLMTVTQLGDRILIVYGAGHSFWLRHFAREVPGFVDVDPMPYLELARRPAG